MAKIKLILRIILFFSFSFSYSPSSAFSAIDDTSLVKDSFEDLTIVAGCGLGGSVLGLSTLPFQEEPSQHLRNILVGGSIGVIVGVAIIAWRQATKSREISFQNTGNRESILENPYNERISWYKKRSKPSYKEHGVSHPILFTFSETF